MIVCATVSLVNASMTALMVTIATAKGEDEAGASLGMLTAVIKFPELVGPLAWRAMFFWAISGSTPMPELIWIPNIVLTVFNIAVAVAVDKEVWMKADRYMIKDQLAAQPAETKL